MRILRTTLMAFMGILLLSGCSQASDVDIVLAQAKKDGKVVMLELGSVGCIPCEQMKPVIAKLTQAYKEKLDVLFIDVKKDHDTARRYGVRMIPTQVFLDREGREFHRHIGFYAYEEISPMLKKAGIYAE
jgi:thioredoxin 1